MSESDTSPPSTKTALTLERALLAHSDWKRRLQEAGNATGGPLLDAETIRRDDCCELGQWLHSSGRTHYGHFPEFQRLVTSHEGFHGIAGIVAGLINAGKMGTAKAMLSGISQFSYASMDVALAINALKKVATS